MLVILGFTMDTVFMYLIMSKRLTPVVALILVPVVFSPNLLLDVVVRRASACRLRRGSTGRG